MRRAEPYRTLPYALLTIQIFTMGACLTKEEESEEARRARSVGMTLADNTAPTSQELNELARREAMAPIKINCQTEKGEVMRYVWF